VTGSEVAKDLSSSRRELVVEEEDADVEERGLLIASRSRRMERSLMLPRAPP